MNSVHAESISPTLESFILQSTHLDPSYVFVTIHYADPCSYVNIYTKRNSFVSYVFVVVVVVGFGTTI